MTAASPLMICPKVNLQALPDRERDVLRQFFTEYVTGIDADHDKEWRRFARDLFNAAPGEGLQLYRAEGRNSAFHRRHRAVIGTLFEQQERYTDVDALHDKLKLWCWHVDWKDGKPTPAPTNFDDCSEARMRKFVRKLEKLLHAPHVGRHFWPHLKPPQRQEMVELVLRNPKEGSAP